MLKNLRVLQFQGLAPSVFCGMYFADQGAEVILIGRPQSAPFSMEIHKNIMNRNKKCIKLSLKSKQDRKILINLIQKADIIIDPYRPGVLEKQKLGPADLALINPKIILLRVTGYGQIGQMSLRAGHDLNYIASSGILKLINQKQKDLQFPANYLADFVSASLGITGSLIALKNRCKNSQGGVVDCSLAGGCAFLTNTVTQNQNLINKDTIQKIKYQQKGNKRFIITLLKGIEKDIQSELRERIQKMIQKGDEYFACKEYEIAEIKTIQNIKNSVLNNPFNFDGQKMSNKIPHRDSDRQYILKKYVNKLSKL